LLGFWHGGPAGQGRGWLLHRNQRWFRFRAAAGRLGRVADWLNPEGGSPLISSDRSPIGQLARRSRAADPPSDHHHYHHVLAPGTSLSWPASCNPFCRNYNLVPDMGVAPGAAKDWARPNHLQVAGSMPHSKSGASAVGMVHQCFLVGLDFH